MKDKLELVVKITESEGIMLNRSVLLFRKPKMVVGLWNNALVFASSDPQTLEECNVLIYTVDELKEFAKEGNIEGMVKC